MNWAVRDYEITTFQFIVKSKMNCEQFGYVGRSGGQCTSDSIIDQSNRKVREFWSLNAQPVQIEIIDCLESLQIPACFIHPHVHSLPGMVSTRVQWKLVVAPIVSKPAVCGFTSCALMMRCNKPPVQET